MDIYRIFAATVGLFSAIPALAQTHVTLSFQVSGAMRSSPIHVPSGINKPPVVFFVHGANGTGPNFQDETKGDVTADREKFIAVYPSAGGNNIWADMTGTGNFPFFLALIDTLDARYKIDRNRIYMTGFSQGGMISFAAACYYSDIFAAVAPVSGHIDKSKPNCPTKRTVPVFMTYGTQEVIPPNENFFILDWVQWLKLNNCPSTAPTITKPYPANKPNSKVTRVSYGPCAEGSSVIIDSISGQGHQWPSPSNLVQADEVWAFFKQYSLTSTPNSISKSISSPNHDPSVQYTNGTMRFGGLGRSAQVSITDMSGQLLVSQRIGQEVHAGTHDMDFAGQAPGVYQVTVREAGKTWSKNFVVP